jgi:hypothetical protein
MLPPSAVYASEPTPKPLTVDEVVHALEKREMAAATVELRWNANIRYEVGAILSKEQAQMMQMRGKVFEQGTPTVPTLFHYPGELRLQDDKMKFVTKTLRIDCAAPFLSLVPYSSSYDGRESRMLMNLQRGSILRERRNTDVDTPHILPILLCYRPLNPTFAVLRKDAMKLSEGPVLINGHKCVRVDDGRIRVYLDCQCGLIPVAFQRFRKNGDMYLDGTIEYASHGTLSFVPKHFELKRYFRPSHVAETFSADITETQIGVRLPDEEFGLKFGPGTQVFDQRTRSR